MGNFPDFPLFSNASFGLQAEIMCHVSDFWDANLRPYLHGSFLPLKDCTLHVVGLRQTMQLEGLTRGFDLTAEDNLAKASVAKTSCLETGRYPSSSTGYYGIASFTPANPRSLSFSGPILGDGFL